jgi:hypothetical protein
MYTSSSITFPRMKKKPNNVTRFGAIHIGSSSTKPFHYTIIRMQHSAIASVDGAYVMLEDVAGDEGFIDARVLVCSQVLQRIVGDAFVPRGLCTINRG